ncbi:MAG: DUF3467 domain-containing protein [Myxococcota bacterium]
MAQRTSQASRESRGQRKAATPKIDWDTANLKSSYANVCNATGTREEVVLLFGISQPAQGSQPRLRVQLSDRIIMSPFAAKRLSQLLGNVVAAYEKRFGRLDVDPQPAGAPRKSP